MATGTYIVEVDWNNDGTFTATGETVTSRTLHVEFTRGRDVNSQLTGKSVAGSLQVILNNQSGDYNSYNSTSPLTGSLLPNRLIQLRAIGPSTATLFRGYIDRIIPQPSVKGLDTVLIEAVGPLGFINQKRVSLPILLDTDTGAAVGSVLNQTGWPTGVAYRDIDAGETTMRRVWFSQEPALKALQTIEETEGGWLREAANGRIVFENRARRGISPYSASTATFTDVAGGSLVYSQLEQQDPLPFIFTEMRATIQPFTLGSTGTLWRNRDTGTLVPTLPASGTLVIWAKYPNTSAAADAVGVGTWIAPTATTDYNIFTDTAGTGTNLNTGVALTVSTFGNEMRMLFNNTGTRLGYITFSQVRGVPLLSQEPVSVSQTSTSTIYGTRTLPFNGRWIPNVNQAKDWADWNLQVYEDPTIHLEMTYLANRSDAHLTQAIVRDLSDRITIVATGTRSNLGFGRDFYIEAIKEVIDGDRTHTVTYLLSEAIQRSDLWVLNTSDLGTRTRLHY